MPGSPRRATRNRLIVLGVGVVLLVAMILNTKFLTPEELAAALPKPFDPKQIAADLYAKAQSDLPGQAKPLAEVVAAIQDDPKAAATKYQAVSPGENSYVFPVSATGTVQDASAANLRLNVPGTPGQTPILVPLGTAVNGTVLRDAMGFRFADAPGQTAFQFVGDEMKKLIQADVKSAVPDPAAAQGKKVTVVGVISVQGSGPVPEAKPVNIQPLDIQVGA